MLFVDDEPKTLKYFAMCLGSDVEVVTCGSAAQALSILEEGAQIEAVISDDRMPGMTGGDLLEVVARRWPDLLRILTTAYAQADRLADMVTDRRVDRVILKPWTDVDLRETISVALELRAARREAAEYITRVDVCKTSAGQCDPSAGAVWQMSDEFLERQAGQMAQLLQIELGLCTIDDCLEEALRRLASTWGAERCSVENRLDKPVRVYTNASCVGGALAALTARCMGIGKENASRKLSLDVATRRFEVSLSIREAGDRRSTGGPVAELELWRRDGDPLSDISVSVAVWTLVACGSSVDMRVDQDGRRVLTVTLRQCLN